MTKFGYGNFRGEITDTEISEFMEANGLGVTIYPDKALFINPDGDLINSKEDERQADGRTEDHRIVSDIIAEGEYMDTNPGLFWGAFHDKTRMIRYVPESNEALIEENQVPTTFQRDTLEKLVTDTLLKMHIKGLFEEDISKIITFANNPDGYQLTLTKVATPVAEEQDSKIEEHNFESTVDPFAEDDYSEEPDEDNDKLLFN